MILKMKIKVIIKLIVSSFLGVIISSMILMFQDENKAIILWMAIYFFPMYFLLSILFNYIVIKMNLRYLNSFFRKKRNLYGISIVLIILAFVSYSHYFYEITLFSFLVNFFAFIFSILIDQQILRKSDNCIN